MDVTLFEVHLDGAQFGPATIGDAMGGRRGRERMDEETTVVTEPEGTRLPARIAPLVLVVGVAVGYAAFRRFRGSEPTDVGVEPVEIEA